MQSEEQIQKLSYENNKGKNLHCLIHYCSFLIIFAVGIYLRYSFLFRPIRSDEACSFIRWASQSFEFIIKDYSSANNHIFHTILMRLSYLLLGMEPWKLRMPAFIAGILIIPATYLLFRLLYDKNTALLASALVASSSFLIEFSVNARGYTLVALFFLLNFSLAYYLIHNQNFWGWTAFALISALGFYTIPVFLYPFGTVCLWIFFSIFKEVNEERNKKLFLPFFFVLLTFFLTFLFYLPVIQYSGLDALIAHKYVLPQPWKKFWPELLASVFPNFELFHRDIPQFLRLILLSGFFLSIIFHQKIANFKVQIIYSILGFMIPVVLLQRVVPQNRIYLFLFPIYYGLASAGLNYFLKKLTSVFKNRKAEELILLFFALLLSTTLGMRVIQNQSVYYSNFTGSFRNAEKVTLFLKSYLKQKDKILAVSPTYYPLLYYFEYHNLPTHHFYSLPKNQTLIAPWIKNLPLSEFTKRIQNRGFNPQDYHFKLLKSFEESNLFLLKPKRSN